MPKKTLTLLGTILIYCLSAMPATAGDLLPADLVIEDTYQRGLGRPVGKFLLVRGTVVVIHRGESVGYRARQGLPVYKLDTLVSKERSRCLVEMNDRSRLSLTARTRITINRSVHNSARRERSSFFSMALGKARFWVTKLIEARRSEFRVKTATAVVGVRGSDFVVVADPATTVVTTLADTEIEVLGITRPEAPVILTDFQQTTVDLDALPSAVMDISSGTARELMNELPVETDEAPLQGAVLERMEGTVAKTSGDNTGTGAGPSAGGKSAAALPVAAAPEIFVDDGELIDPEPMGEDETLPAAPDPLMEDFILREQIEALQETREDIAQQIYEETVAGELPGFPGSP